MIFFFNPWFDITVGDIVHDSKKPLILIDLPTFYETVDMFMRNGPVRSFEYWPLAFFKYPGLNWISLKDFLPWDAPYEEKYSWFTLPHDGHPSNIGAQLYGEKVASLLSDYLIGIKNHDPSRFYMLVTKEQATKELLAVNAAKEKQKKSDQAMAALLEARKLQGENRNAALKKFTEAIDLDPFLGAPGVIFQERGNLYMKMNLLKKASEEYSRALKMDDNPVFRLNRISADLALERLDDVKNDLDILEAHRAKLGDDLLRQMRIFREAWSEKIKLAARETA